MDCRVTLRSNETFLEMLTAAQLCGQKVYLLVDDNGISRMEGFIRHIGSSGGTSFIELDNYVKVEISKIAAVNGIFLSAYSEC